MSVLGLFAGGIDNGGSGVIGIMGGGSTAPFRDSSAYAQVTGQRRLYDQGFGGAGDLQYPGQTVYIAANGSRAWLAQYWDVVMEDTIFAEFTNNGVTTPINSTDYIRVARFLAASIRELRVYGVHSYDYLNGLGTGTSTSGTVITDTTATWTVNQWVGRIVIVKDGIKGTCTSNTATTITVDAWLGNGTPPASNPKFNIQSANYPKWRFSIWDGQATPVKIADGDARTGVRDVSGNRAPDILEWKWVPANLAANNLHYLYFNGVVDSAINGVTGGGTGGDPTTTIGLWYSSILSAGKGGHLCWFTYTGGSGGNTGWFAQMVAYDNLTHTGWDTFPIYSSAPPAASSRPLITYRQPKTGQTPTYDSWTKSTGTDAAALIDEIRAEDDSDYISTTSNTVKQSWKMMIPYDCDIHILSNDTIYAVETVGSLNGTVSSGLVCLHTDGTNDDAGRTCQSVNAGAFLWCAYLAPDGGAWTFEKLKFVESVAKSDASATSHEVNTAGQLVLFKKGAVPASMAHIRDRVSRPLVVR